MTKQTHGPKSVKDPSRKFTKPEKSWILYDWANSVYATNMMAAIFPIYYAGIAGDAGDKWWGIGVSAASLIIAVLSPIFGSIGDFRGMKKKLLCACLILGIVFTAVTAFTGDWKLMLIGYVISHIGFSGANVFYDSFLTDVTTRDRMDRVSSWGYAMGYLGGSTIPFVISIVFLLMTGFSVTAVKFSILLTCVWWAVFSIPLLKNVKQTYYVDTPPSKLASAAMHNLGRTMKDIVRDKGLLLYLVAYFFYIDGVGTVINLATNYGATLGLGSTGMILALLVTQLVAVPFSILFSRLASRVGALRMIGAAIGVYVVICGVGFFMGLNVEPYQMEYTEAVNRAADSVARQPNALQLSASDRKIWETMVGDLRENGKNALSADDREAAFWTEDEKGNSGVLGDVYTSLMSNDGKYAFSSAKVREWAAESIPHIHMQLDSFITDAGKQEAYAGALRLSSLLFWVLAFLVGTVQGGIQALSRSYFGKLVPPERSNEYFGFYDIFGKFASVIGPMLYSLFYMATGRASIGIISLLVLFGVGGVLLFVGRKHLPHGIESSDAA